MSSEHFVRNAHTAQDNTGILIHILTLLFSVPCEEVTVLVEDTTVN